MIESKYNWKLLDLGDKTIPNDVFENIQLDRSLISLLWSRGFTSEKAIADFLSAGAENIHDPMLMHDMDKGIERIQQAIVENQKITVYGDYDADGLTSTSIMFEVLSDMGADVETYIPNRFIDGYGPNIDAYKKIINNGTALIITVDNGVSGNQAIEFAQSQGVDVIVTDHHELPEVLPNAYAIIHPRHPEGHYPFGDLSGAGVAFKVASALTGELSEELLDLVAIGTIADLVSLTDENRAIASFGLKVLQQTLRPGLISLMEVASLKQETVDEKDIGFGIAPRLNAIGRLGDANIGVELLTTLDDERAKELATFVQSENVRRQKIVADISELALQQAETDVNQYKKTLVISGENWHEGVLGIVASRVVEATGKPTIVLNQDTSKGQLKGSGRSIQMFHLFNAINKHKELTSHFGGHHMAVGLTIPIENLEQFSLVLENEADIQNIQLNVKPDKVITSVLDVDWLTADFYKNIEKLKPFGMGNEKPVFEINYKSIQKVKAIGKTGAHLKFEIAGEKEQISGISFSNGKYVNDIQNASDKIKVIGEIEENVWLNKTSLQLMVQDIKSDGLTIIDERTDHISENLFQNEGLFIFWNSKNYKRLERFASNKQIFKQADQIHSAEDFDNQKTVIFVDCPISLEKMSAILHFSNIQKIIMVFLKTDSAYLDGMPSREQYASLYKFAMSHKNVDINNQLIVLSNFLKIKKTLLIFMIKVFLELEFVKIKDGLMTGQKVTNKMDIKNTSAYQLRNERMLAEEQLVYSKENDLKKWILAQMNVED
ncbi:single-stranded-DNA-specific exonuclease RecJ [Dellaglioa sp. BT-FLS60]